MKKNKCFRLHKMQQLNWYDHVQIMNEERLPRKILEWFPPGISKGRPWNSWMQEVTTGMWEKGINNMEWVNRGKRRRNIKLKLETQKDVQTLELCTQIIILSLLLRLSSSKAYVPISLIITYNWVTMWNDTILHNALHKSSTTPIFPQ